MARKNNGVNIRTLGQILERVNGFDFNSNCEIGHQVRCVCGGHNNCEKPPENHQNSS